MTLARKSAAVLSLCIAALALLAGSARAQQPALKSHEVNADGSVTIRYYAPTAQKVWLNLDYSPAKQQLAKGPDGVWSLTTTPLAPAVHTYALVVDGTHILDPLNAMQDPAVTYLTNQVRVPGGTPQLWDDCGAPHGVIHHHLYRTKVMKNLRDGDEDYYVYTPPGYDASAPQAYPVLYLLHGWSALANSWVRSGQADLILDNLLAQGRIRPMLVVMPQGYGDLDFAMHGPGVRFDTKAIERNFALFEEALLSEIIPRVEKGYHTAPGRENRAIAGLSMGGGESLRIGLNHPDVFAWIGGFSSAVMRENFDGLVPALDAPAPRRPRLLWIACGTGDELIGPNRRFEEWLKARGLNPVIVETDGIHNWPVWRDDLIHFAPMLFR